MIVRACFIGALVSAGCGDGGGSGDVAQTDTVGDTGETVTPPPSKWQESTIETGRAGRQIQAAVLPDGTPIAAAYREGGEPGDLCDPATPSAGSQIMWTVELATGGSGGWTVEKVADIAHLGAPRGLDLAVDGNGAAVIAALTGAVSVLPPYCGANDLGLYRKTGGAWTAEVAVAMSNEAATGEAASDFGNVVGLWPGLAFDDAGGAFVVYRDVHGGGLQGDDFTRADLESAWQRGGGWTHAAIAWGKGMGELNAAAFDGEGRPLVLAFNPRDDLVVSERGLFLFRGNADGTTWERVALFRGGVAERPSLVVDPTTETVWVAWYDGEVGLPYVARLEDPERFDDVDEGWVIEDIGDHVFDEGRHPSIAVSGDGVVGVAYQRCGRASDGIGDCNPGKDAVVFAWRDGDFWEREIVKDEADGLCGNFASLVFSGERPVVFYQCEVRMGDEFVQVWRSSMREAL